MAHVQYKTENVDGVKIFYREAGSPSLPGLLLLHGHASGSHTFRNIIPGLADTFRVVAPDYPGFANSDRPSPSTYQYNFVNVAATIAKFTEQIGLSKFVIYTFDYGAPVGFNIAVRHPERVTGIFSQSGCASDDGLSPAFQGLRTFWANPKDEASRGITKVILSPEGISQAYHEGVTPASLVGNDPESLDRYYISREGAYEIQELMLLDYENVVKTYPEWQAYLREHKPKVVAVWGKNDPFFIPPGAEAFKRDVPDADVTIVENGAHFMNESHPHLIIEGLKKLA